MRTELLVVLLCVPVTLFSACSENGPVDTDGDGISDAEEGDADPDDDGLANRMDDDSDGDGIGDADEAGDADLDTAARDTDGDEIPDFLDADADADAILDADEGAEDPDGDAVPSHLDDDSDGDGLADATEAGDVDVGTPPRDSDEDGTPDFVDTDSDDDGLSDARESSETLTSPIASDSDLDGEGDLVEVVVGTDPNDAEDNPRARGDFAFLAPHDQPSVPGSDTLTYLRPSGAPLDITAVVVDDPSDAVDVSSAFGFRAVANADAVGSCSAGLMSLDYDGDGVLDTFRDVPGDGTVCFDLVAGANETVVSTGEPQLSTASIQLWLDHVTLAEEHHVYFVVPPR